MTVGVVLAGGRSSRMGRPKALVEVAGMTMVERVASVLRAVTPRLICVTHDAGLAPADAEVLIEASPHHGPLSGIATALEAAGEPCLIVGCDMPLLSVALLGHITTLDGEAVVIDDGERLQPLHSVYRPSCLSHIRDAQQDGDHRARALLERADVRVVGPDEWRRLDPSGTSWMSVNTPADVAAADQLLRTAAANSSSDAPRPTANPSA